MEQWQSVRRQVRVTGEKRAAERHIRRVCRCRENTSQTDLWLASGLTLASKGFRNLQRYE